MLPTISVLLAAYLPANAPVQVFRHAPLAPAASIRMGYVPDGMSKEQYEALKAKERSKIQGKNLGIQGVTTFRSRTLDFRAADEALAQGEKKKYRFPDKTSGNKNNYVRVEGGKQSFRTSAEYKKMLAEKEAQMRKQREEAAKITGAGGRFQFGRRSPGPQAGPAKRGKAAAPPPAKKGGLFGSLFGK